MEKLQTLKKRGAIAQDIDERVIDEGNLDRTFDFCRSDVENEFQQDNGEIDFWKRAQFEE